MQTRRLLFLAAAFSLVPFFGCGSGKNGVELQGKVVLPNNLKLGDMGVVTINFVPEDPNGKTATGKCNSKDQTFVVNMVQGKGVLPGKYKVTVQVTPYLGSEEAKTQANAVKKLNERYNLKNSKLSYEVTADPKQSITIDLSKGSIQKS